MEPENNSLVKEIQNSFLVLLNDYLPKDLLEKVKDKNTVKAISICCGRFREAKSIFDYFSGYESLVKLYGIEIDKDLLDLAKNEKVIKENAKSVFLKLADASQIKSYQDWLLNGPFELVIMRHPEITFNTDTFIKIFSLCASEILAQDGYLFVTTHFENEKDLIKLLFKTLNLNLLVDVENKLAPSTLKDGNPLYADKFLLISGK